MKIAPHGSRIIAKIVQLEAKTQSTIIYTVDKNTTVAEIVSVGTDVANYKVGDKVMFLEHVKFPFFGQDLITFTEDKVIGVVSEEKE